ncbi:MAG: hypothetical protein V2B15_06050 [Bacteroidota bacterium]
MKTLKLIFVFAVFISSVNAQQISPLLVGTNLWYNDPGQQVWNLTRECGVKTIRIGGHAYDKNPPSNETLLDWVQKIQAVGAEPILQVSQYQSAEAAAALVRFFNVEKHEGLAPVKYWNIGNEPWLQAGRPPLSTMGDFVEAYFKPIAAAMKAADPAIRIYGPDFCDYFDEPFNDLFGGKNDITVKVPGKDYYYCDGLSWHRYPQGDGDPAVEGACDFLERIKKSKTKTDQVNALHKRTGNDALIWGIGEYNSKGGPEVHTWGNGQMFGEVLGWCMEYEAAYAASWSMFEHGGDRKGTDFSLIDGAHMTPRASCRHMEFVAKYFTGAFLKGRASDDDFLVYGAQDGDQLSVMIMNRSSGDLREYTLFLKDTLVSGPGLTLVVQGQSREVVHDIIGPRTTQVLVFKRDSITKINYTSDDFEKELPPVYSKKEIMQTRTQPIRPITLRQFPEDGRYVNLESFYNFSSSEEIHGKPANTIPIPSGINDFMGVKFDARGIIQLASNVSYKSSHIHYPEEIIGIPVNHLADSLCFLQSSAWESETGTEVVHIVVHYANNQERTIAIRHKVEVADWWVNPEHSIFPHEAELAWEGSNPRVEELGLVLKLYRYTWVNPMPDVEILSIDLVSAMNDTGYMLFGITCL